MTEDEKDKMIIDMVMILKDLTKSFGSYHSGIRGLFGFVSRQIKSPIKKDFLQ